MLSVALLRSRLAVAGPNGQRLTVEDAGALGRDLAARLATSPVDPQGTRRYRPPLPGAGGGS